MDSSAEAINKFLEINEFLDPINVVVENFFALPQATERELLDLKNNIKNDIDFYLEISLHSFLNNYYNKINTYMVTHENHKVEDWSCFNNPLFQDDLKQALSSLNLTNIKGIIFSSFRYPTLIDESMESDGITCFWKYCQEESRSPQAAEDVKIRELSDKKGNHVNLNEVKAHILKKSKYKFAFNSSVKDKKLKKWYQFRCNSLTKLLGSLLIHLRSINMDVIVGTFLSDMKIALEDGQIYEDIATYHDFISIAIEITSDLKIDSSTITKIHKKLKKAEGKVNFIPFFQLTSEKQLKNLNTIRKNLIENEVSSAIFQIKLD